MKEFGNLAAFALHLATLEAATLAHLEKGLDRAAARVQKTAKAEIGQYQDATGPFPKWAELAQSTKADRLRQGYTENDPGLRSGAMRQSIERQTRGLEAVVGSNDDDLLWFELGTAKQPPRPVLGPAAERNRETISKIVGGAVVTALLGGKAIGNDAGQNG